MNKDSGLKVNNDLKANSDVEVYSIEELLSEIDNLENREPWKKNRQKNYESNLVDIDSQGEDTSELTIQNNKSSASDCDQPVKSIRIRHGKDNISSGVETKRDASPFSLIFDWVKIIVIAVIIALVLNKFIIANAIIPSGSMESTIMTGDRVIGLRISYLFSEPDRGDIVIFKNPDDESKLYIKRIIGLPGDKIEIKDGLVYINDSTEPLEEPYITVTPKGNFGPYQVPEESYFMLGDNRNVSKDSRYWDNTFVEESKIIARAYFRYYPSIGLID